MPVTYTYEAPVDGESEVSVTFMSGEITHERTVNAVFADGAYDADATEARIAEVASGVENKISVGAIQAPQEEGDTE